MAQATHMHCIHEQHITKSALPLLILVILFEVGVRFKKVYMARLA